MKIGLFYHSGSGSTKNIARILKTNLNNKHEIKLIPVTKTTEFRNSFDFFIFGFPTHHCEPSITMKEFVDRIPKQIETVPIMIYTTYGLYHGNCIRNLANSLRKRNLINQQYMAIRGPGSDGALLFPQRIKFMYKYQKSTSTKIDKFSKFITNYNKSEFRHSPKLPLWRIYVPINDFFKIFTIPIYQTYSDKLQVDYDRCIQVKPIQLASNENYHVWTKATMQLTSRCHS